MQDQPTPMRPPWGSRLLLGLAFLWHLALLTSRPAGLWERFAFDAVATQGRRGWDFYALYQAGHNALTGTSIYESDNDKIEVVVPLYTPYRYLPPPAYTLGVLLNALPPSLALALWTFATEVLYLFCAYLAWRSAGGGARGSTAATMWLCFTPYYLELYLGQFNVLQGALILVMLLAPEAPRWRLDLAWMLSLLWKQNTALLAPVLLRARRWRTLGLGMGCIGVTSLPYFALHPSALRAFLTNFSSPPPTPQMGNLGVRQFLYSALSALFPSLSIGGHATWQVAWVGLIVALGLWLTSRANRRDLALLICLWITAFFLVYHQIWEHHYILLLPVYTWLYGRTASRWLWWLYLPVALWTPYILVDPAARAGYDAAMRWTPLEPRWLDVAYHASKALPTLGVWMYLAWLIKGGWASRGRAALAIRTPMRTDRIAGSAEG